MSPRQPGHLPPEALAGWFREAADMLGVGSQVNPDDDIAAVLDLTKEVSTAVARPAGPLTMFLLGLALGGRVPAGEQVGGHLADLEPRVRELAVEHGEKLIRMPISKTEREK